MEKLNKKLILEFLEDTNIKDVELDKLNIEKPIQEPIEVKQEELVPTPELSEPEKVNFILSVLSDLNNKVLDIFNYLTPYVTNIDSEENLSEDNKTLLTSVYEDVSLILGKLSQGLKDNSPENIQNAIDDGQTEVQETIVDTKAKEDKLEDKE